MISSDSIQYMAKKAIKNTREPLTVLELRDFLNRLIMGSCGNFKLVMLSNGFKAMPTHYTINGHDNTVTVD